MYEPDKHGWKLRGGKGNYFDATLGPEDYAAFDRYLNEQTTNEFTTKGKAR